MSDVGVDGTFKIPAVPVEGMRMDVGGPITQRFLETIEYNNNILNQLAFDVEVRNVNGYENKAGENKPRKNKHKHRLDRDIAVWAETAKFKFGNANHIGSTEGFPSWRGFRYDFPSNSAGDYFHDAYLPVVVCQMMNTEGLDYPKISFSMTRIATNFFKFDIFQLESSSVINNGTDLWVNVLAVGRRGDYWPDLTETLITPNTIGTL